MPLASCFFHCSHRKYDAPFAVYRNHVVFIGNKNKYLIASNLTTGQPSQLRIHEACDDLQFKQVYNLDNQLILVYTRKGEAFTVPIEMDTISRTFRFLTTPMLTGVKTDIFKMLPNGYILKTTPQLNEIYSIRNQRKIFFNSPPTTNPTPLLFVLNEKVYCLLSDCSALLMLEGPKWIRHDLHFSRGLSPDMLKFASISVAVDSEVIYVVSSSPRQNSDDCEWLAVDVRSLTVKPLKIEWSSHRLRQNCRIAMYDNTFYLSGRCAMPRCSSEAHLYALQISAGAESASETVGPGSLESSSSDIVFVTNNAIACPVCYDTFVDPKQLPCCGNSLCSRCEERITRDRKLQCPICRQTNFFRSDTDQLQPNRALKDVIDHLCNDDENSELRCSSCANLLPTNKTFYCTTCDGESARILCGCCGLNHHLTNADHQLTKTDFVSTEKRREMLLELPLPPNPRPLLTSSASITFHTLKTLQNTIDANRGRQNSLEDEFLSDELVPNAVVPAKMDEIKRLNDQIRKASTAMRKWDERMREELNKLEVEISSVFMENTEDGS